MERLLSPCTRYRDIALSQRRHDEFRRNPDAFQELNLDVSTQELLGAERAFTYADLHAMLGNQNKVAWLTPNAFVVLANGRGGRCSFYLHDDYRFRLNVDGKNIQVLARSWEAYSDIADVVLRLLAVSVVHSVILDSWRPLDGALINATSLAYLMGQCQSLKALTLKKIALDEDNIRVLGECLKPDLEIKLDQCQIKGATAAVLAQVLGSNQGPTKLDYCYIDNFALADGLRGNSRLKSLIPRLSTSRDHGNQELLAIAGALKENAGLVRLYVRYGFSVNDETWDAVCNSLKTHPTLQVFRFNSIQRFEEALSPSVPKPRIQALVGMLKMSMSIHTIHWHPCDHSKHERFRGSVTPYLETNMYRSRVRAIQKARPIAYRAKVLGRALVATRTDANRCWMFLSGNADVAFPLTATATTTPAVSLPTPATATATSNAAAVAATAAVAVTATRTGSTTTASAATNVATPTACCTFTAAVAVTATRTASTPAASAAINVATPTACCTLL
jgi:hypothetical protein